MAAASSTATPRTWTVADGGLDLAAVVDALSTTFTVTTGARRVEHRTGVDTFDRRLRADGLGLEHRSSGTDRRLVLWRADGQPLVAPVEHDPAWPARADALPPGPVRDAVAPVIEVRALLVVSDEKRRVRRLELRNGDRKTVVRVELDEPTAASGGAARVTVLPLRGYDREARGADRLLADLGLVTTEETDETDQVEPAGDRPQVEDPDAPATALLAGALVGFLDTIRRNVPGVVDDVDTEFLHDLRVAVRRTRSTLKLGRPVLPGSFRSRWEPGFKWVGDLTTPVRDLDVYQLDLPTMGCWLVATNPTDLAPFAAHLDQRRTTARATLVRGLRSKRFHRLVTEWEAELDALGAAPSADETAGALAARSIARAFRRVAKQGSAISVDSPAQDLHALRKRCKELRYALEVFAPVVDAKDRAKAVKDLKGLQDVLGRFQDSEVQRHALRDFAEEMMTAGTSAGAVLAMGELIGHLDAAQDRARGDFDDAFARFVRPAGRRRLGRLGSAG